MKKHLSLVILLTIAFITGVLFTTAGANLLGAGDQVATNSYATPNYTSPAPLTEVTVSLEEAFVGVAEAINPTVVQIRSERVSQERMRNPFEEFFGRPDEGTPRRAQALGSGVIARSDGYIITNNHVIDGADALEVKLYDGTFYDAEVVGTDPNSDLAVIKVDAANLPAIRLGEIDNVKVGQWTMAFGSPLSEDLGNTVTAGIVSALGRTSTNLSSLNIFAAFIQTDAAINPGNSGGPLVNLKGELIGINSAIYSRTGGNQGIGFAIPVDVVRNVTDQLIETGAVERGNLGVYFEGVSTSLSEALEVPRGAAQVTRVLENSAAENAGLKTGDIIIAVDGFTLQDPNQLRTIIGNKRPGENVALRIVREDDTRTINVRLGRRSEALAENEGRTPTERRDEGANFEALGLSVQDLTERIREATGIGDEVQGVLLANVDPNSEAAREANLRRNDIIVEVNRQRITSERDFRQVFRDIEAGDTFLVRVLRYVGENPVTLTTALTKPN